MIDGRPKSQSSQRAGCEWQRETCPRCGLAQCRPLPENGTLFYQAWWQANGCDTNQGYDQCVLVPRKIGELELDFENPTWKSNWEFEQFTAKFTVSFTVRFNTNLIIDNITPKIPSKTKQNNVFLSS